MTLISKTLQLTCWNSFNTLSSSAFAVKYLADSTFRPGKCSSIWVTPVKALGVWLYASAIFLSSSTQLWLPERISWKSFPFSMSIRSRLNKSLVSIFLSVSSSFFRLVLVALLFFEITYVSFFFEVIYHQHFGYAHLELLGFHGEGRYSLVVKTNLNLKYEKILINKEFVHVLVSSCYYLRGWKDHRYQKKYISEYHKFPSRKWGSPLRERHFVNSKLTPSPLSTLCRSPRGRI